MLCYAVLYYIILYHIIPYIISYHISYHIIYIISYIISYYIILYYIILYYIISYYIILYYISHRITSHHITICALSRRCTTSPHITSPPAHYPAAVPHLHTLSHKRHDFRKKVQPNTNLVFGLSPRYLHETFLILRRILPQTDTHVHRLTGRQAAGFVRI